MKNTYGLEQARAQLPLIAAEAAQGSASVITRHGKAVAAVVPMAWWQQQQLRQGGVLALRGSGRHVWPQNVGAAVARLRDEWPE